MKNITIFHDGKLFGEFDKYFGYCQTFPNQSYMYVNNYRYQAGWYLCTDLNKYSSILQTDVPKEYLVLLLLLLT